MTRRPWPILICSVALVTLSLACESLVTRPTLYGRVDATVRNRKGEPVPGAALVLYTGQRPMGYATTDATGSYRFLDVPEGTYGLRAIPPAGYLRLEDVSAVLKPTDVVDQLVVTAETGLAANFTFLKRGFGSVIAQVSEPDGAGVARIPVILYSPNGALRRGVTDATGRFVFDSIPLGNYGVFAERPTLYLDSAETSLPSTAGLIVDEGRREPANFIFARCTGSVNARVIDNTGAGVRGALLIFYTATSKHGEEAVSDDGSKVFAPLICDDYGVRVQLPVGWMATEGKGVTFADGLRVRRGSALTATLRVQRIGRATVRVRIADQNDSAVANARVVLYTGAGIARDVVTDANGVALLVDVLVNELYGLRVVNFTGYLATEGRGTTYEDNLRLIDGETRTFNFRFFRP